MTTTELHIDLDQKLDKVDSRFLDNIERGEKDWWLNEATNRFIKQRLSHKINFKKEGHSGTRKRINDLKNLLTPINLPCYYLDANTNFVILPPNFEHSDNELINLEWNCNGFSNTLTNSIVRTCTIPFSDFPTNKRFRLHYISDAGDSLLFDLNTIIGYTTGVANASESFYLLNIVKETINNNLLTLFYGIKVYWEWYNDTYAPNSLIFVIPDNSSSINQIRLETYPGPTTTIYPTSVITYQKYVTVFNSNKVTNELRVFDSEDFAWLNKHPFAKPTYKSPTGIYEQGRIKLFHDSTFVPITLDLFYYRTPKKINYISGQSCELHPDVHSEIVDIAVGLISAAIGSSQYSAIKQENIIHE